MKAFVLGVVAGAVTAGALAWYVAERLLEGSIYPARPPSPRQ